MKTLKLGLSRFAGIPLPEPQRHHLPTPAAPPKHDQI